MRRLWAALLLAAVPGRAAPPNPGDYVHLTTRDWETLDPADSFDSVSFILTGNLYEPLFAFKSLSEPDVLEPFLAAELPTVENGGLSADGLRYAFAVRKGVRFHDGRELTSEDVRYSLMRFMLADSPGGPASLLLQPLLGVSSTRDEAGRRLAGYEEAARAVSVEDGKVVLRLAAPAPHLLKVLASLPIIVSRAWAAEQGAWDGRPESWERFNGRPASESPLLRKANGTGPFKFLKGGEGESVLVRHEGYWRAPAALERVYFRVVPGRMARLWMLECGDADAAYFEDRDYAEAREVSGVRIVEGLPAGSVGELLFFGMKTAPDSPHLGSGKLDGAGAPPELLRDLDFRRGFAHLFDEEAFLAQGLGGRGERAGSPIPPALLGERLKPRHRFSMSKARRAFRRALGGELWKKGFTLSVGYKPSNGSRQVLAELLRERLQELNPAFKLKLVPLRAEEFYEAVEERRLPLFIGGYYADYPDPLSFAYGLLHSGGYYPKAQGFADPELDRLIEEAAREPDLARRRKLFVRVSERAADAVPQVWTHFPRRFKASKEWVRGADADQNVADLNFNNFPYFYALSKE